MKELWAGDKKQRRGNQTKIQGTEHKWREQKQHVKLRINPFENWKKEKKPAPRKKP